MEEDKVGQMALRLHILNMAIGRTACDDKNDRTPLDGCKEIGINGDGSRRACEFPPLGLRGEEEGVESLLSPLTYTVRDCDGWKLSDLIAEGTHIVL